MAGIGWGQAEITPPVLQFTTVALPATACTLPWTPAPDGVGEYLREPNDSFPRGTVNGRELAATTDLGIVRDTGNGAWQFIPATDRYYYQQTGRGLYHLAWADIPPPDKP